MSGFDPYKLWVEFRVGDETYAGFSQLKRSILSSTEGVAALKKELASVRANSLIPTSAIAARQEMLVLAKEESSLREKMALSVDANERKILATKIEALGTVRTQMGLQRESLALQERSEAAEVAAAAAAERRAVADARAAAAAAKAATSARAAAIRSIGGGIHQLGHVGTNMMWGGAGILGGMAYATQKAADFDQTTFQTDLALGGYNRTAAQRDADMRAMQKAAFAASNATGFFSAQQIMEGMTVAATSGMRPIVEKYGMGAFTAVTPALAQYMDIEGRLKGQDAATAAKQAIQTAHMFGAYTPEAMRKVWNESAVLSMSMPDTFNKAISLMSYVAPVGKYLSGMTPAQIMAFSATADQSGMAQRGGGARLKDYIEAITVMQSPKREAAKHLLGLGGALDKNGNLDLTKSFEILHADRMKMGAIRYRNLTTTAFGQQGVLPAAMFGDPAKAGMYKQNLKVIQDAAHSGSLEVIQNFLKTFGITGKEAIAVTRLSNDLVQFGQYGIPIATKFFDEINPKLKEFGDWITEHPKDAAEFFNEAVRAGEGLLIVGGGLKAISMAWTAGSAIGKMAKGISAVRKVLEGTSIAGELEGVGAGLGAVADALALPAIVSLIGFAAGLKFDADYVKKHPGSTMFGTNYGYPGQEVVQAGGYKRVGLDPVPKNYSPEGALVDRLKGNTPTLVRGKLPTHATTVHVEHVSFELPAGTSTEQGSAAMQHFLHLTGTFAPHPAVPNPMSVGGSNLVYGT